MLDEFFVAKGPVTRQEVPWPLDPKIVLAYLIERLIGKRRFTFGEASRIAMVVDAYLLRPFAPAARKALVRAERNPDDVSWSAAVLDAIGEVGEDDDLKFGAEYYEYLMGRRESRQAVRAMIPARNGLGPHVTSKSLATAMTERATALAASPAFEDGVEGREVKELRDNTLQEVDWADAARKRVNAAPNVDARIKLLMDIYFERTEDGGISYLMPWVVRQIRMHAHFGQRPQVIAALERESAAAKPTRDAAGSFAATRALHALEYFGADLDRADREFLKEHADDQPDPISIGGQTPHRWFEHHE
jgi:hypothetical protein